MKKLFLISLTALMFVGCTDFTKTNTNTKSPTVETEEEMAKGAMFMMRRGYHKGSFEIYYNQYSTTVSFYEIYMGDSGKCVAYVNKGRPTVTCGTFSIQKII